MLRSTYIKLKLQVRRENISVFTATSLWYNNVFRARKEVTLSHVLHSLMYTYGKHKDGKENRQRTSLTSYPLFKKNEIKYQSVFCAFILLHFFFHLSLFYVFSYFFLVILSLTVIFLLIFCLIHPYFSIILKKTFLIPIKLSKPR